MRNDDMMTLKINRLQMVNIITALQSEVFHYWTERESEGISEDRKAAVQSALNKWTALRDEVTRQFEEQDV